MNTRMKCRIKYNEKEDSFEILIKEGECWELDMSFPCIGDCVHFSILNELKRLALMGYELQGY